MFNPQWQQVGGISNATSVRALEGAGSLFDKALGNIQNVIDSRSEAATVPLLQELQKAGSHEEVDNILANAKDNGWANQKALTEVAGVKRSAITQALQAAEEQQYTRSQDLFKNRLDLSKHQLEGQKLEDLNKHRGAQIGIEEQKIHAANVRSANQLNNALRIEEMRGKRASAQAQKNSNSPEAILKRQIAEGQLLARSFAEANAGNQFGEITAAPTSNEALEIVERAKQSDGKLLVTGTSIKSAKNNASKQVEERFAPMKQAAVSNLQQAMFDALPDEQKEQVGDPSNMPVAPEVVKEVIKPIEERESELNSLVSQQFDDAGLGEGSDAESRKKVNDARQRYIRANKGNYWSSNSSNASILAKELDRLDLPPQAMTQIYESMEDISSDFGMNVDYAKAVPVIASVLRQYSNNPLITEAIIKDLEDNTTSDSGFLTNATAVNFKDHIKKAADTINSIEKNQDYLMTALADAVDNNSKLPANERLSSDKLANGILAEMGSAHKNKRSTSNASAIKADTVVKMIEMLEQEQAAR